MADTIRDKQIAEAEELLGEAPPTRGFAKGLFFGEFLNDKLPLFPDLTTDPATDRLVEKLKRFCHDYVDPVAIDREAMIPQTVVDGLGQLGVLGACMPKECGGLGLSQTAYCRLLEVLGGRCASTALFVNAHHSIGPRAIVLFGTPEQRQKWLPNLASGRWLSAFALTEPEAGSDAANVQTTAMPTSDGLGYLLNGQKRWITNGGIAQVLTVMARTPVPGSKDTKITAFIVTPDMPGFEVVEARMEKCGVRGTATGRLAFNSVFVPRENVLGPLGKGLKVALTVLDFGRTTFGATCLGAARFCLGRAVQHANSRVQFGQPIGAFELVKEKLAFMRSGIVAIEAATYLTAQLIDSGHEDYMLETAMLKVFATETLWRIINDTIQIYGGKAYFTDEPFERMMRDARINQIGEGANDVLRAFIALVGMREAGLELRAVVQGFRNPIKNFGRLSGFVGRRLEGMFRSPEVRVHQAELESDAARIGKATAKFAANVERLLRKHREGIVDREYQLGRIGDSAIDLYISACVLRWLEARLSHGHDGHAEIQHDLLAGRYFLATAERRIGANLAALWDNDDALATATADAALAARAK
jgi:alkylation response protein AidB-like acyl-CoA dehydrogenase